ncbi:MAG: ankyrin repeat domain-containing protein [Deltaproteobacteria bacterium]|nr:ankyrin repeat domain-containing protein [Deltaproteobacteria bacterium]
MILLPPSGFSITGCLLIASAPAAFRHLCILHRGDKGNTVDRMQALINHGANVDARGPGGKTALHYAAASGSVNKVRMLLAAGADRTAKEEAGLTPSQAALAAGKPAVAQLLDSYRATRR